jgi:hypothetical protein
LPIRRCAASCYELYIGALNETYQQIEGVALVWKGRLDSYKITDAGTTLSVEVAGESRAIDQRRPAIKRFTDEYQQRKHPGDKFFQYVSQMTEVSILWAKSEQSARCRSAVAAGAAVARRPQVQLRQPVLTPTGADIAPSRQSRRFGKQPAGTSGPSSAGALDRGGKLRTFIAGME